MKSMGQVIPDGGNVLKVQEERKGQGTGPFSLSWRLKKKKCR